MDTNTVKLPRVQNNKVMIEGWNANFKVTHRSFFCKHSIVLYMYVKKRLVCVVCINFSLIDIYTKKIDFNFNNIALRFLANVNSYKENSLINDYKYNFKVRCNILYFS